MRGDRRERELALLWVLNLSDGKHSLLDIAERANLPFALVRDASVALSGGGSSYPRIMRMKVDCAIIGGGIVGSSVGIAPLRRQGVLKRFC